MIYVRIIVAVFLLTGTYLETGFFTVLCFALCLVGMELLIYHVVKLENKS